MTLVKEWTFNKLFTFAMAGAKAVTDEQAKEREKICRGCPNFGKVNPLPAFELDGCTLCGCPLVTKTKFAEVPRLKGYENNPLSMLEILEMKKLGKIKQSDIIFETVICPDTNNRWAEIDNLFNKKITQNE